MHRTTTSPRKRRLTCAETAKLVRQALRAEFPETRFSVRSKTYSGGASIDVRYVDGPTSYGVEAVLSLYRGAEFDGMVDLKTYRDSILTTDDGAELVHFGADFLFAQRDISEHWQRQLEAEVCEFAGGERFEPNVHYPVSCFVDHERGGAGLARDDHRGEYGSALVLQLSTRRDRSKPCQHGSSTYGVGNGWNRCKGCGMRTRRRIEATS